MCFATSSDEEVRTFIEEFLVGYGFAVEGEVTGQTKVQGLDDLAINLELRFGIRPDFEAGHDYTVDEVVGAVSNLLLQHGAVAVP